jgi:amino acid transporter
MMQKVDVKIGTWIEEGFNLYKNNFGTLVLASVIALVLSAITFLLLIGPMIAGLIIVTLQLLRKEDPKPDAGRVFRGFNYFLNSFLFMVIWGLAILIGSFILSIFHVIPVIGQLLSLFFAFDCRQTDEFLAGLPEKHPYGKNQFLAFFGLIVNCQCHWQYRRYCFWYWYCFNHPYPGLHTGSRLSGNIR